VWVAVPRRPGGFVRVAEGGAIKERIDLTDRGGFACMLGGPDRRTLFMLEALGSGADSKPGNGRIRAVAVEVAGAGWP
jgi:sugar lactone lactonase YvrE